MPYILALLQNLTGHFNHFLCRCFGLRFTPADHDFLHQSHVFSNISKILSLSEEVLGAGDEATSIYEAAHAPVSVCRNAALL